jgi:AraC-like DNA-binding protein
MPDPASETLLEFLDVQLDAFALCEVERDRGRTCPPLDSILVHFVIEGEGVIGCEHGRYEMWPGRILLVPRNLARRVDAAPVRPIEAADPSSRPSTLRTPAIGSGAPGMTLACGSISAGLGGLPGLFDNLDRPHLQECGDGPLPLLLAAMAPELRRPRTGSHGMIEALMKQVLIVVLRSHLVHHLADSPLGALLQDVRLRRAVRAVVASPEHPHSVDSLAALAGVSRSCLSRHFSAGYGCSPMGFVHSIRMRAAARMLMGSDLPVKSVAVAVGYASRSQFSRAFTAQFGSDPSRYRKRCQVGGPKAAALGAPAFLPAAA